MILARTDAEAANLITSDHDDNDKPFLTGERTQKASTASRTVWSSPSPRSWPTLLRRPGLVRNRYVPDLGFAREFAEGRPRPSLPGKLLAYNCSPSFNWKKNLNDATIASSFQEELSDLGYKYQFITWPASTSTGTRHLRISSPTPTPRGEGMKHYVNMVQEPEFHAREQGYTFVVAPAGSRYRLLRRRDHRHPGRLLLRQGPHRIDRRRAVPLRDSGFGAATKRFAGPSKGRPFN